MDVRHDLVLKEHYTFLSADRDAQVRGAQHGLYNRDTRFLSRYAWRWLPADQGELTTLLAETPRPDTLDAHYALLEGDAQALAVRRRLALQADGLHDELEIANHASERRSISLELEVDADFVDVFEVRGWHALERPPAHVDVEPAALRLSLQATDGVQQSVTLRFDELAAARPDGADWELSLSPGERVRVSVRVAIDNPLDTRPHEPVSYEGWRASFAALPPAPEPRVLARAIDDLRGLLLFTPQGPVAAAGAPWYVAAFGRDALLSAHMLLPHRPDVAEGTLRFLAAHQGTVRDPFRVEAPGKIPHELRYGELSRLGRAPHARFYGTVDATPLFLTLLEAHRAAIGSDRLVRALRPQWEAALAWLVDDGDLDGDGFIEYQADTTEPGVSLGTQSWKDAGDAMTHADGSLAQGAVAVSEVQGYAYAAFQAAAGWYEALGEGQQAQRWREHASELRARFQAAFWLDDLDTYALALDGDKQPLRVRNSDAGHLLWSGIVPREIATRLVRGLLGAETWSGWGLRTLGSSEVRYNPLSYHRGSVWPHDTALFAAGLARYGFTAEAHMVRDAIYELAARQADLRVPELVAGYARGDAPPVPYPAACRPQAWDAAALVFLLGLDGASSDV